MTVIARSGKVVYIYDELSSPLLRINRQGGSFDQTRSL